MNLNHTCISQDPVAVGKVLTTSGLERLSAKGMSPTTSNHYLINTLEFINQGDHSFAGTPLYFELGMIFWGNNLYPTGTLSNLWKSIESCNCNFPVGLPFPKSFKKLKNAKRNPPGGVGRGSFLPVFPFLCEPNRKIAILQPPTVDDHVLRAPPNARCTAPAPEKRSTLSRS